MLQRTGGGAERQDPKIVEAHRRVGEVWDRLDRFIRTDYRQRLHREGDRSGRMLDWLLKRERPPTLIVSLRCPDGSMARTQQDINAFLWIT